MKYERFQRKGKRHLTVLNRVNLKFSNFQRLDAGILLRHIRQPSDIFTLYSRLMDAGVWLNAVLEVDGSILWISTIYILLVDFKAIKETNLNTNTSLQRD